MQLAVALDRVGSVGLPDATEVRRDDMIAGVGQRGQLIPPRVPQLGVPMKLDDERLLPSLCDVHADAVALNSPMRDVSHTVFTPLSFALQRPSFESSSE